MPGVHREALHHKTHLGFETEIALHNAQTPSSLPPSSRMASSKQTGVPFSPSATPKYVHTPSLNEEGTLRTNFF